MNKLKLMVLFLLGINTLNAQNILNAKITDAATNEPLAGATVYLKPSKIGGAADEEGVITLLNIPNGKQVLTWRIVGYETRYDTLNFPLDNSDTLKIQLQSLEEEMEEIEITSTRSSRSIKDIPTRVEYIVGEELEEKGNMKPGDIRMLLAESTGIQTQQTSATSANASIRIQGLDGRYTQILKDGFPLYSGFSGGLGLLQTPPLDLKQAEVIKGSSSTLYGGGAIAGMVNLISKTPTEEGELRVFLNGTSAKGLDINTFYGKRKDKFGFTVYAARNSNAAFDPSGIGLTAIPKFERYTFNPRVYFYPNKTTKIMFGVTGVTEERKGGDVSLINGDTGITGRYFENNATKRLSSQFHIEHKTKNDGVFNIKNSVAFFDRKLTTNNYTFSGKQTNSFTELSYLKASKKLEWIGGLNVWTENFKHDNSSIYDLDYIQNTIGAFAQNTWKAAKKLTVESGLRVDHVIDYGTAFLPRLSLLYKQNPALTYRLGGGMGYKAPTIFTEATESILYQSLVPIRNEKNGLEKSYGLNGDINYRFYLAHNKLSFNINQLFFYTRINSPLLLSLIQSPLIDPSYYLLSNSNGHIDTKGGETNIKVGLGDFKLFLGYTFTHTDLHTDSGLKRMPLTPKHRLNTVLMYEIEGKWKVGLEGYYFGKQTLGDGKMGKDYWICGFMVEKLWEKFSVFINFENFFDARQTRFDTIYTGTLSNPNFRDIYAPLDGFVVNGGIKYFPFGDTCCKK
jgi:outer membrane receptor for ferrienterochelin and colicins